MLLYIIRHGEPNYATDSLTENGKVQADALAERMSAHGLDEVYSSPMGRAIQTAQPTCSKLKLNYKIEEWMSEDKVWEDLSSVDANGERDWAFNCQNTKLINTDYSYDDWHTMPLLSSCRSPSGCYQRISRCSDEFLNRLGYKREGKVYKIISPSDKNVAAFCHHGFGTVWLSYLLSIPLHIFWAGFDISHSCVTILELKNNPDGYTSPKCMCLSDVSHLYKDKIPLNAAIEFFDYS